MVAKLNHPLVGPVTYTEYEWWEGEIQFPEFDDCRIQFDVDMNGIPEPVEVGDEAEERERIEITINVQGGNSPSTGQEAAIERLITSREAIAGEAMRGLLATFRAYMRGMLTGYEAPVIQASKQAIEQHKLDTEAAMKKMVTLLGVDILENEKDGEAYMTLEFNCAWDFEHGTSLLFHKGIFIVGSSGADFSGRETLEGHVQALMEFSED